MKTRINSAILEVSRPRDRGRLRVGAV